MLTLQQINYTLPTGEVLLANINLSLQKHDKIALIGNNGTGKSTLFQLICGNLTPTSGEIFLQTTPYLVPQVYGQFNDLTIAQALKVDKKLNSLNEILTGNASALHFEWLADDWTIENRIEEAFAFWHLQDLALNQKMSSLSGGQQTKVFLAGIKIHQATFILLDEPSNHLDGESKKVLIDFLKQTPSTVALISHDRALLNNVHTTAELNKRNIKIYPGNYDFYANEKETERQTLRASLDEKEKMLRKARENERVMMERQQKLDARGKQKQEKAGVSRIMMNTLRNKAENSTSKTKSVHFEKINNLSQELTVLRSELPDIDYIKFGLTNARLHRGKLLFKLIDVNFGYKDQMLWHDHLNFQISSGDRIAIKGANGAGKTTLLNILLGKVAPVKGQIFTAKARTVVVDQSYASIENALTVYEQAQQFNENQLLENEVKTRLHRFLFEHEDWQKKCGVLSGGEKMRLILCGLTMQTEAPDILVLDEPTNNLDLQNMELLSAAIRNYEGTLIVISHDENFLVDINIEHSIFL